tara:strand:- start:204 stop:653 length:450 start_codon:yes stop_codon:yes gene_type:complete
MKKILIIIFFFISACGYQPIYKVDKEITKIKIKDAKFSGDQEISKEVFLKLPFIIEKNDDLNTLIIESKKIISETSKNQKGQATSYRTSLNINLKLTNLENKTITEKKLKKEFSYDTKKDKFKLKRYQKQIEKDLIDKISKELIIFFNL